MKFCFFLWIVLFGYSILLAQPTAQNVISQENVLFNISDSLYKEGSYAQALHYLNDFIDLYPNSPQRSVVMEKIARIYEARQEFLRAAKMYHKLYEDLSDTIQGLSYYLEEGRLLELTGQYNKAESIYKAIIEAHPNSDIALLAQRKINIHNVFSSVVTNHTSMPSRIDTPEEDISPIIEEQLN